MKREHIQEKIRIRNKEDAVIRVVGAVVFIIVVIIPFILRLFRK
jgi:hypothetical protein